MYDADRRYDSRFPASTFDPKAVTRASWEPKPQKPKQNGPLISFNRHPDAHMVLNHRSTTYSPMSPRTKSAIKWIRRVQLFLRVLQLNAAVGILVVFILLDKIDEVKGWVMRIAPGIVILHTVYAIYHLSREANGRTPSSSAAYQVFSVVEDLATLGLYAFSAFTTHQESATWTNRLSGRKELTEVFVPAVYYGLVGAGSLHAVTLIFGLWLAWAFRKISMMPPDMNPLEDNLTARPQSLRHKRNKSSMSTLVASESESPYGKRPGSEMSSFSNMSPRRSVPFMHTRQNSSTSFTSRNSNHPDRQYQIIPGNTPRNSATLVEPKRTSRPQSAAYGSYAELPLGDPEKPAHGHRDSVDSGRVAKFTETWAPTDSLVNRTNERNRQQAAAERQSNRNSAAYAALTQRYNGDESDSDYDDENDYTRNDGDLSSSRHPNPLGSNPLADGSPRSSRPLTDRTQTPFYPSMHSPKASSDETLSEVSPNRRHASNSKDITDIPDLPVLPKSPSKRWTRNRDSSIQADSGFYSKPYGELKSATPPVMVGNDRKTSSGNDFGTGYGNPASQRRNVSGKVAEEGMVGASSMGAGNRTSQYGFYSNRNYFEGLSKQQ